MNKAKVDYGRVHFAGSVVFAMFFALLPAVLVYKITGNGVGAILCFLPAVILLTRVLLWAQERVIKEDADSVQRRYKAGRIPIGKER